MIHNHGPREGEGLECPELRLLDGSVKGSCLVTVQDIFETFTERQKDALYELVGVLTQPTQSVVSAVIQSIKLTDIQKSVFLFILNKRWGGNPKYEV